MIYPICDCCKKEIRRDDPFGCSIEYKNEKWSAYFILCGECEERVLKALNISVEYARNHPSAEETKRSWEEYQQNMQQKELEDRALLEDYKNGKISKEEYLKKSVEKYETRTK